MQKLARDSDTFSVSFGLHTGPELQSLCWMELSREDDTIHPEDEWNSTLWNDEGIRTTMQSHLSATVQDGVSPWLSTLQACWTKRLPFRTTGGDHPEVLV